MATTRLRKAFRYPDDSDDGQGHEELDEEGQSVTSDACLISLADDLQSRRK